MKKIRKDVFETNSSSTHALTLGRPLGKNYVSPGKYLKIKWFDEEETLTTLEEKVSYLVSHIASWYKWNAPSYEALIEEIKDNWDFKRIERFIKENYNKEIVFPEKYDGALEDIVEINHQLQSWNHRLDEVLEELVDYERDYLAEVLQDGQDIEFGRD